MTLAWYVAETHPCYEHTAAEHLARRAFPVVYPRFVSRRPLRGRVVEDQRPLFPGYIFVEFDLADERWKGVKDARGVRRLFGGEQPLALPVAEAARLLSLCRGGPMDSLQLLGFAVGAGVMVRVGLWAGYGGRVVRLDTAQGRVVVLMALLGREYPMEYYPHDLELDGNAELHRL